MDGHSSAGMAKQEIEAVSKLNLRHMTDPSDLFSLPKNGALPITGCFTCTFRSPHLIALIFSRHVTTFNNDAHDRMLWVNTPLVSRSIT